MKGCMFLDEFAYLILIYVSTYMSLFEDSRVLVTAVEDKRECLRCDCWCCACWECCGGFWE